MKKFVTAIVITGLTLGGATLATADSDYHGKGEHHGKYCEKGKKHGDRIERMRAELGLSESQVKQMQEIKDKFKPQKQALREKMRDNRKQLRTLMHADSMNEAAINKAATVQAELVKEKILLRSKMKAEMNKVLTAEQREKMKTLREQRMEERHEKHGKYYEHD